MVTYITSKCAGKNCVVQNNTGLRSRIVLDLLDGFEDKNLHIYMDRFYCSPDIFVSLADKGIGAYVVQSNPIEKISQGIC